MKFLQPFLLSVTLAVIATTSPLRAAEPRHGAIVSLEPIENRGEDENPEVGKNRKVGELAGTGVSLGILMGKAKGIFGGGNSVASQTAETVATQGAPLAGAKIAEKIGGTGPTTRYMVKVKLDSRKVLSITQLRQDLGDLKQGDRVIVTGTGDDAKVARE